MKSLNFKKAIPAFTMILIVAGSIITYNLVSNNGANDRAKGDSINGTDSIGREIQGEMAQLKDQFQIGNRHYIIVTDEQKAEFKLPGTINKNDIGDKLTTVTTSIDESLKGCDVYKYIPAGGEAVVAVKKDNEYRLFKFFTFDSYNNNQDEDTITYLKLYGINSPADIAKIQFINRSEQAKIEGRLDIIAEITDSAKIAEFYRYYSVIKNSSDQYFDKLFNQKSMDNGGPEPAPLPAELAPDYAEKPASGSSGNAGSTEPAEPASDSLLQKGSPDQTITNDAGADTGAGTGEAGVSTGSAGSGSSSAGGALSNSVTIRIYNQSGIYFDAEYYPTIGFISRHEVNEEFAGFLKGYIG